jgi:NAD(P)-dependent dehydrogenase (short-subunit alcohol dehydrogenase family)
MGGPNSGHYAASKWGIVGLVKSAAIEAAPRGVTVNAVAPTAVDTPLVFNPETYKLFHPDLENPTWDDAEPHFSAMIPQGVPHIEAVDVSRAIAYLASDDARYVTGSVLDVSGGKAAY